MLDSGTEAREKYTSNPFLPNKLIWDLTYEEFLGFLLELPFRGIVVMARHADAATHAVAKTKGRQRCYYRITEKNIRI